MLELGAGCGLCVVVFVYLDLENRVVISKYHILSFEYAEHFTGSEISRCLSLVLGVGSRASFSTSGLVKSPFKDDFQANGLFNDDF